MRFKALLITCCLASLLASGCGAFKEKPYTPSEAEKKLAAFCLKEGTQNIITKRINKTLWVYLPMQEPIFDVKPSSDRERPVRKISPFSLLSLQAEFSESYFKFNFDIVPDVLAPEPTTYGSTYNEKYTKKRQLIYQGLQESFFNAKATAQEPMPEFVALLITDINKGIATQSIFYLRDLRQYMTEVIPPDEYYMREINEVIGNEALIQDMKGRHAPYTEVTWAYFLTEQIKNRIKFKFQGSDFPPHTDPMTEIAKLSANTLRFYPFDDYKGIVLYAVREKKENVLAKAKLKDFSEKTEWEKTQGRLTTIHFKMPTDPTEGVSVTVDNSTNDQQTNSFNQP